MAKILVETSARHIHVTDEQLEALYGQGYKLTVKKELSQPGQFACVEKVTIVGPKGEMTMSILGPFRKADQVEISMTDCRKLGVQGVVRESGDIDGTSGIEIANALDETKRLTLDKGVIAAKRHIHATVEDALALGVKNGDIVKVEVNTQGRSLIFGDTVVRVSDKYALAMHIDTDESNAANCSGTVMGKIVK